MVKAEGITKDAHTIKERLIKTSDGLHTLYVQEWGNPKGIKILYLHGGPGDGCSNKYKAIFDTEKHYVIFLDQRGSGNSKPYGSIKANTTKNLVKDIELVRSKLEIDSWIVYGKSWGSTLALCYTIAYPSSIKSLIIGGVYLGTKDEINWIEEGKLEKFYPDIWEEQKGKELDSFLYAQVVIPALSLDDRHAKIDKAEFDDTPIKIERHFNKNANFLPDNYVLNNSLSIKCPVAIIQGRYDMITPPISAYKLHKALPNSKLYLTIAGHKSSDRGNYDVERVILDNLEQ